MNKCNVYIMTCRLFLFIYSKIQLCRNYSVLFVCFCVTAFQISTMRPMFTKFGIKTMLLIYNPTP